MSEETQAPLRPATFREVFAQAEFRALYSATTLTWIGDYLAKAAITVMVYNETRSVAMSAAAFAVSFLPWIIGGPLLATVAERHPYRTVMVTADLIRMVLIALVALPFLPVWATIGLLFLMTLANPPSQAARSALMPVLLKGDRLVVGLSVTTSTSQAAQVGGYVAGAAIAAVNPRIALVINAAAFAASALILRLGVRKRPPAMTSAHRSNLFRETGEGFQIVFGTPVLRATAVMVFAAMLFAIVPEGLAAAWAAERPLGDDESRRGLSQALIMAAGPVGFILGSLVVGRAIRPDIRRALIRPFAVLAPLALVPALLNPSPTVVALLAAVSGVAIAGLLPVANGLFVQALPHGYRARAFGVMQTGMQVTQGGAVLLTGLLASRFSIPTVVGVWSAAGVLLMLLTAAHWPSAERFNEAIAKASRQGREQADPDPAGPVQPDGPDRTAVPSQPRPAASKPGVGAL
ncbi:MFS transporter [Polymorphospora sp. NPDC050346]|uniref:MFS transporter n=1 Tax=Polymorphospora sp. NPDC050346 TaxID=3155780 RepID=UPI00340D4A63